MYHVTPPKATGNPRRLEKRILRCPYYRREPQPPIENFSIIRYSTICRKKDKIAAAGLDIAVQSDEIGSLVTNNDGSSVDMGVQCDVEETFSESVTNPKVWLHVSIQCDGPEKDEEQVAGAGLDIAIQCDGPEKDEEQVAGAGLDIAIQCDAPEIVQEKLLDSDEDMECESVNYQAWSATKSVSFGHSSASLPIQLTMPEGGEGFYLKLCKAYSTNIKSLSNAYLSEESSTFLQMRNIIKMAKYSNPHLTENIPMEDMIILLNESKGKPLETFKLRKAQLVTYNASDTPPLSSSICGGFYGRHSENDQFIDLLCKGSFAYVNGKRVYCASRIKVLSSSKQYSGFILTEEHKKDCPYQPHSNESDIDNDGNGCSSSKKTKRRKNNDYIQCPLSDECTYATRENISQHIILRCKFAHDFWDQGNKLHPFLVQMNGGYSTLLVRASEAVEKWNRVFLKKSASKEESRYFVYALGDHNKKPFVNMDGKKYPYDIINYVGQTCDYAERMRTHSKDQNKWVTDDVNLFNIQIESNLTKSEAIELEAYCILLFAPKRLRNKRYNIPANESIDRNTGLLVAAFKMHYAVMQHYNVQDCDLSFAGAGVFSEMENFSEMEQDEAIPEPSQSEGQSNSEEECMQGPSHVSRTHYLMNQWMKKLDQERHMMNPRL